MAAVGPLSRADLERVQRTCASFLEPVLLFVLKRPMAGGRRRRTPWVSDQRTAATSRNADTKLRRLARHPRMCAIPLPAIGGLLDRIAPVTARVEPTHDDAECHARLVTPAGRWGCAPPRPPRRRTRPPSLRRPPTAGPAVTAEATGCDTLGPGCGWIEQPTSNDGQR